MTYLHWIVAAAMLLLLVALLFARLRAAEYPPAIAATLSGLALCNPAVIGPASNASTVFAVMIYGIAVTAFAYIRNQNPRRIILLGVSLASAQLVNPVCGALSTLSIPLVLRNLPVFGQAGRTTGQVVSLLFIPVLTGVTLTYVWLTRSDHLNNWSFEMGANRLNAFEALLGSGIGTAPIIVWILSGRSSVLGLPGTIGALSGIVVATGAVDAWLGLGHGLNVTLAVGPLAIVVLSELRGDRRHIIRAMLLMLSCVAAWWLPPNLIARLSGA